MQNLFRVITGFGDAATLLPVAAAVLICLWWGGETRLARGWGAATALCVVAMVALKLAFHACSVIRPGGIASPSGHAALAATVYGALAILVAMHVPRPWQRALALGSAVAWIAAIAASRMILAKHDAQEVLLGLAVGGACVAVFWRVGCAERTSPRSLATIGVVVAALVFLLHGERADAETILIRVANALRTHLLSEACADPGGLTGSGPFHTLQK